MGDGLRLYRTSRPDDCHWHFYFGPVEWASFQLRQGLRAWEQVFNEIRQRDDAPTKQLDTASHADVVDTAAVAVLLKFADDLRRIGSRIDATTLRIDQTMTRLVEQQHEIEQLKRRV